MSVTRQSPRSRRSLAWLLPIIALAAVAPPASAALDVSGGLDTSSAWVGDDVSFWMRIRNDDGTPFQQLKFQVVGKGVTLSAICTPFSAGGGVPCVGQPVVSVPAHSDLLFGGTLHVANSGDHRVTLQGVDMSGRVITISLGSLSATSRAWSVVEWTKGLVISLTLPIVLAALGIFYQRRMQREQDDRKSREQGQADDRAKAERATAERATSVRLMLPVVHGYSIRYYVDLAEAYKNFAKAGERYVTAAGSGDRSAHVHLDEAVFSFIKVHLIRREFYQQIGGMYLANLIAEEILGAAYNRLHRSLLPPGDAAGASLTGVLDALQQHGPGAAPATQRPGQPGVDGSSRMLMLNRTKFAEFLKSVGGLDKVHHAIRARLKKWLGTPVHVEGLECAQLYGAVLNHEMNLSLQEWYGDVPPLDVTSYSGTCTVICGDLDGTAKDRALKYLGI